MCAHKCAKYGSAVWFLLSAQKGKIFFFLIFLLEGKKRLFKKQRQKGSQCGGSSFTFSPL